jgi:hypothetical protein
VRAGLCYVFGWNTSSVTFFGEIATLGKILIAFTYLGANLALPVYFRRFEPAKFSPVVHLLLPVLGAAAIGYPLYELVSLGSRRPMTPIPRSPAGSSSSR